MNTNDSTRFAGALVTLGLLAAACSGSGSTSVVDPQVSVPPLSAPTTTIELEPTTTTELVGDATPELQSVFDELVVGAEGGAVAAVRVGDGPLMLLASGSEPNGDPLAPDAVVRVGSISKVVTSTLILSLVEEGTLTLDDPLSTVLPDTPVGGDATIRQLLSHRTGIANYTDEVQFLESVLRRPSRVVEVDDVLGFADPDDALFAPGEDFSYSNTNYVLLGQVLETATGEELNTLVRTRISEPLGLDSLSFDLGDRADVAGGHSRLLPSDDTSSIDYTSMATSAWAAGSLVTSVEDLARFITALHQGELISPELVAEMRAPIDNGEEYGLGLHPGPELGLGHGGAILGFNSLMQHDADTGDLLIVVVNNDLRSPEALTTDLWEAANAT
jgi:D-alanyl-D-alanine carboxypeptidase